MEKHSTIPVNEYAFLKKIKHLLSEQCLSKSNLTKFCLKSLLLELVRITFFSNLSYFAVIVINWSFLFCHFIYLFIFALSGSSSVFIVNVISAVVAN